MITIRRAGERLRTRIGWLDSRHTFSFEEHIDPRHMGFRALRVMNEDRIAPAHGYGTHTHRDVEIVTYVLEAIHQDVAIFSCLLEKAEAGSLEIRAGRHAWVQVVRGSVQLNGVALTAGDGASACDVALEVRSSSASETLLFDLA